MSTRVGHLNCIIGSKVMAVLMLRLIFFYLKSCIGKGLRKACKAGFLLLLQMWRIYSEVEIFSTRKHTAALTSTSLYSPLLLASLDLHQPLKTPPTGQPQSPSASTAPGNFLETTPRDSPLHLELCKNYFSQHPVINPP